MVLVDGHLPLPLDYPQQPVIKGDDRCRSPSPAASILAKVHRDRVHGPPTIGNIPSTTSPRHKGYPTKPSTWRPCAPGGPCPLHRRTFKGVKEWMEAKAVRGLA
jgi:ribonuclease HII